MMPEAGHPALICLAVAFVPSPGEGVLVFVISVTHGRKRGW